MEVTLEFSLEQRFSEVDFRSGLYEPIIVFT